MGDLDTSAAFGAERIILDSSAAEQERSLPPITPDNVSSVASDDYKRKTARDKTAHVFWARMECGLVLSSVSPWEIVDKKKGETKGGYVCRHCRGFWRGGKGKSAQLQLMLDEPPQHLYEAWVKDRIDALSFTSAWFSKKNLMGNVSDLIWSVVLSNPEKEGLKKIHEIA
ncbi:unnamed protein product, partial [Symbiodinium sp. KB8]